jgi:hypothetical protein
MATSKQKRSEALEHILTRSIQPISVQDISENKAYNNAIKTICLLGQRGSGTLVGMYYDIGKVLKTYKEKNELSLREVAEDIQKATNGKIDFLPVNALRSCLVFATRFTDDNIIQAQNAGITVSRLLSIAPKDIPQDKRDKLIKDIADGGVSDEEVESKIAEAKPKERKEKRGGARVSPLKLVKNTPEMVCNMEHKLKGYADQIKIICDGDSPEDMKLAFVAFDEAVSTVESFNKMWAATVKNCTASFKKVEEVLKPA